eukprot:6157681-Pleurochrysis_carterae.AAC.4
MSSIANVKCLIVASPAAPKQIVGESSLLSAGSAAGAAPHDFGKQKAASGSEALWAASPQGAGGLGGVDAVGEVASMPRWAEAIRQPPRPSCRPRPQACATTSDAARDRSGAARSGPRARAAAMR